MNKSQIDSILSKVKKQASAAAQVRAVLPQRKKDDNNNGIPDDEEEYVPVGLGGMLAASQKLLAVNRGLINPDDRDALMFKRILTPDKLMAERIKLDADRIRGSMLPLIARHKNLKALGPFAFDSYMEKMLIGNPLSSPLEEINPLHLLEQARRATQMGPGGIGTDNAITEDMQAIRTDQFGFISPIEGPESMPGSHFVYTKQGWLRWAEVNEATLFACNIDGELEFHNASKINVYPFEGELICAKHNNILMELTPHHRVYYATTPVARWSQYKVALAEDLYGKAIRLPCWHYPCKGRLSNKTSFDLPGVGVVPIDSFAYFMGWVLSEGNITAEEFNDSHVCISQSSLDNPDCFKEIEDLLKSMSIKFTYRKYGSSDGKQKAGLKNGFLIYNPELYKFLLSYIPGGSLCHEKGFPEDLLEFPIHARKALLHSLMQGAGRVNKTRSTYYTTSILLAHGVERLIISLGYPCRIKMEPDRREHVKTTNYAVCQFKCVDKTIIGKSYYNKKYPGKTYGSNWYKRPYKDLVYCATVPGSKLFVRGSMDTQPYWTGNSERIGIDTRAAWNSKIGSDGKPYQKFFNRKTGKYQWMSPEDLDGLTVKLPD